MKDLFSKQAELYSRYRPSYPAELYDFILGFVREKRMALDCATGNGQVAQSLSPHFKKICAIDISDRQLQHAVKGPNIEYAVSAAEQTPFADDTFDLITVAQAYHWFRGTAFCSEARRIGRNGAVVAVWGYDLAYNNSPVESIIRRWNFDTLASYWEPERKHVYNQYADLLFEFESIPVQSFRIVVDWSLEQLTGNLRTWSALQKMTQLVGDTEFRKIVEEIGKAWGNDRTKRFVFPIFLKLGRVVK